MGHMQEVARLALEITAKPLQMETW